MPINTKTNDRKPTTTSPGQRARVPRRPSTQAPQRWPALSRSSVATQSGLVSRVQATLPSPKRKAKQTRMQQAMATLSSSASRTTARAPGRTGMLSLVVGGLGAAAVTKRRRGSATNEPVDGTDVPGAAEDHSDRPPVIEGCR